MLSTGLRGQLQTDLYLRSVPHGVNLKQKAAILFAISAPYQLLFNHAGDLYLVGLPDYFR